MRLVDKFQFASSLFTSFVFLLICLLPAPSAGARTPRRRQSTSINLQHLNSLQGIADSFRSGGSNVAGAQRSPLDLGAGFNDSIVQQEPTSVVAFAQSVGNIIWMPVQNSLDATWPSWQANQTQTSSQNNTDARNIIELLPGAPNNTLNGTEWSQSLQLIDGNKTVATLNITGNSTANDTWTMLNISNNNLTSNISWNLDNSSYDVMGRNVSTEFENPSNATLLSNATIRDNTTVVITNTTLNMTSTYDWLFNVELMDSILDNTTSSAALITTTTTVPTTVTTAATQPPTTPRTTAIANVSSGNYKSFTPMMLFILIHALKSL